MGTPSNLHELTVTCSQCGSASMERIGPREYRCNHCGAITVVSQDSDASQRQAPPTHSGPPRADGSASIVGIYPGPTVPAKTASGSRFWRWFLPIVLLGFLGKGIETCADSTSSSTGSATTEPKPVPAIPVAQASLAAPVWMTDPTSSVHSGRYVSILYNHSAWPMAVPRYSMTLYTDGIKGPVATSEAPLARLLPGEYEPVSFAFETPNGSTRTEIQPPASIERADGANVPMPLTRMQLVREDGKPEYRLVGLLHNAGKSPVKTAEVLVMLFGANRTLLGYGSAYARALRPGEQAAVDVHIPTSNVQPVVRYEYLVDATAEDAE